METFDKAAYASNLAMLVDRPSGDIKVIVSASSVLVQATITTESMAEAASVVKILSMKAAAGELGASLKVRVESYTLPTIIMQQAPLIPPPRTPLTFSPVWPPPFLPATQSEGGITAAASTNNVTLTIILIVVGVAVACGALVFLVRRLRRKGGGKHDGFANSLPAFLTSDVGKRVTIRDNTVFVDGVQRHVQWKARHFGDGTMGKLRHKNVKDAEIIAVADAVGGMVTLNPRKASFENPATPAERRFERLESVVGSGREAPVRLIKADHFVEQLRRGGRMMARFEIAEEDFYTGLLDNANLDIIVVSCLHYPRSSDMSTSPEYYYLRTLAPLLEARAALAPSRTLAVFLDTCSLDPRVTLLYRQGLQAVPHLFGHPLTEVWLLSQVPEEVAQNQINRGWFAFHHVLASSMWKLAGKCLDFGLLNIPPEEIVDWSEQVGWVCALPLCPPLTALRFSELLKIQTFAESTHRAMVIALYELFLSESLEAVHTLRCRKLQWGDLEACRFAEVLPLCRQLRVLDLSSNPTDGGCDSGGGDCELDIDVFHLVVESVKHGSRCCSS